MPGSGRASGLAAPAARVLIQRGEPFFVDLFPPSSREFYAALCTSQEALERLEAEMKARPAFAASESVTGKPAGDEIATNARDDESSWLFI